jgi:hypothetical protein
MLVRAAEAFAIVPALAAAAAKAARCVKMSMTNRLAATAKSGVNVRHFRRLSAWTKAFSPWVLSDASGVCRVDRTSDASEGPSCARETWLQAKKLDDSEDSLPLPSKRFDFKALVLNDRKWDVCNGRNIREEGRRFRLQTRLSEKAFTLLNVEAKASKHMVATRLANAGFLGMAGLFAIDR